LTIDLQRISVKILSEAPQSVSLSPFLEIFAHWRAEKNHPAEWIDLADYAHVPRGPGIMLVGLKANVAFDLADPAPGILYVTRKGLDGTYEQRLHAALRAALELSRRLIAEKNYPASAKLRTDSLELRFPDRLLTPNNKDTDAELRPAVDAALNALFGAGGYKLTPFPDSTQTYGFAIQATKAETLSALLERLT